VRGFLASGAIRALGFSTWRSALLPSSPLLFLHIASAYVRSFPFTRPGTRVADAAPSWTHPAYAWAVREDGETTAHRTHPPPHGASPTRRSRSPMSGRHGTVLLTTAPSRRPTSPTRTDTWPTTASRTRRRRGLDWRDGVGRVSACALSRAFRPPPVTNVDAATVSAGSRLGVSVRGGSWFRPEARDCCRAAAASLAEVQRNRERLFPSPLLSPPFRDRVRRLSDDVPIHHPRFFPRTPSASTRARGECRRELQRVIRARRADRCARLGGTTRSRPTRRPRTARATVSSEVRLVHPRSLDALLARTQRVVVPFFFSFLLSSSPALSSVSLPLVESVWRRSERSSASVEGFEDSLQGTWSDSGDCGGLGAASCSGGPERRACTRRRVVRS